MQSSRTLPTLPRLLSASLRLRLHNADDYPTCQLVAAIPEWIHPTGSPFPAQVWWRPL